MFRILNICEQLYGTKKRFMVQLGEEYILQMHIIIQFETCHHLVYFPNKARNLCLSACCSVWM